MVRLFSLVSFYQVVTTHLEKLYKVGENAPGNEATTQANATLKPTMANANTQPTTEETAGISSMGIPQFLKRMSMGILSK